MATKWVITVPADRIELDSSRRGETTFTVTNPTDRPDRAVLDIVAGDGADPGWFTIDEPQRRVPPNGSVSYLVSAAVPGTVPAGEFSVRGRAYSADSTPEEDSVLSGRLTVRVVPEPAPARYRPPWWLMVVAGLVVVSVVVVLGVVLGTRSGHPAAAPTPAPTGGTVGVPAVGRQSESSARVNLTLAGLRVGTVRHQMTGPPDSVVYQSVAPGSTVPRGTTVDLVVTASLAAPHPVAPLPNTTVPGAAVAPPTTPVPTTPGATPTPVPASSGTGTTTGVLRWTDPDPFVGHWQVTIQPYVCVANAIGGTGCLYFTAVVARVDHPWYTPILQAKTGTYVIASGAEPYAIYLNTYGGFQWQVAPVDDFGTVGQPTDFIPFRVEG